MSPSPADCPHILFLFSDTGGGHRSAAEAIIEALRSDFGHRISFEMVDFFKEYAPTPFNYLPDLYPQLVRVPPAWGLGFYLSNGRRRVRLANATAWPIVRKAYRQLFAQHPSQLIVSVHPIINHVALRVLGRSHTPYITVVTDMVTTHAAWFHRRTDLCLVPTDEARQRGLRFGLRPDQLITVGLPVAQRFCQPPGDKALLRQNLGWPQDRPVVVMVGGGEGMGPLEKNAQAIAQSGLPIALVIIAGRNQALKKKLENELWPIPTYVYGFVREMPDFMSAADVLITKAGPGTISEAFNAGLPIILYSRLPGQEDGNVSYVINQGAGVWAPTPEQVVATLQDWIYNPSLRFHAAQASHNLARPEAARNIAHLLAQAVGVTA